MSFKLLAVTLQHKINKESIKREFKNYGLK